MTNPASPNPNLNEWPPGGLEAVTNCPACRSARRGLELTGLVDLAFGAAPGQWTMQRCGDCGSTYLDPRPNQETIHLAYRNYYTHTESSPAPLKSGSQWLHRAIGNAYRNRLFGTRLEPAIALGSVVAPFFPKASGRIRAQGRGLERLDVRNGRVLDIGCGNGDFLMLAREMGWHPFGVEFDEVAANLARAQGIEVFGGRLATLRDMYDSFFDAVTLCHVIEHLSDPVSALQDCYMVMKPGAYIWIETPNIDSVGYETYGRFWRGLEPPRHLTIFGQSSICDMLRRAAFAAIKVLPSRDVLVHLFTVSAMMATGLPPATARRALSHQNRRELDVTIRHARSILRNDPSRSEFLTVACIRPTGYSA
jgi:2-polyprenyl-3-methyl-5-hydroxy-6-metoxy-1,4-benzoquinol methylase